MSTWRQYAEQVQRGNQAGDNRDNRDDSSEAAPNGPNVPLDPVRALRAWQAAVDLLDPNKPLHGIAGRRWRALCGDADWFVSNFGEQAARDRWASSDLFGLWPAKPHWGGVVDRLGGSRSLVMTADRACWRDLFTDQPEQFARGAYPELSPFWEASR